MHAARQQAAYMAHRRSSTLTPWMIASILADRTDGRAYASVASVYRRRLFRL